MFVNHYPHAYDSEVVIMLYREILTPGLVQGVEQSSSVKVSRPRIVKKSPKRGREASDPSVPYMSVQFRLLNIFYLKIYISITLRDSLPLDTGVRRCAHGAETAKIV